MDLSITKISSLRLTGSTFMVVNLTVKTSISIKISNGTAFMIGITWYMAYMPRFLNGFGSVYKVLVNHTVRLYSFTGAEDLKKVSILSHTYPQMVSAFLVIL